MHSSQAPWTRQTRASRMSLAMTVLTLISLRVGNGSVLGSRHDLSTPVSPEPCVWCHAADSPSTNRVGALWDRSSPTATFDVYSSANTDAVGGTPSSHSLLCLGCHDGTVSPDEVGHLILGANSGGGHPVSIPYPTTAEARQFRPPPDPQNGWGAENVRLVGGRLECVSCHNVHDPDTPPFLNVSNAGSALCLTCHAK